MSSWARFVQEQPELAGDVERHLRAHTHLVMATLRADGSARLCGTEVTIGDGALWLAGMPGARRFADLRRDPRVSVHSGGGDLDGWSGDARVSGLAVEVLDAEALAAFAALLPSDKAPHVGGFELFRIDLTEAMCLQLSPARDALEIRSWRPGEPVRRARR